MVVGVIQRGAGHLREVARAGVQPGFRPSMGLLRQQDRAQHTQTGHADQQIRQREAAARMVCSAGRCRKMFQGGFGADSFSAAARNSSTFALVTTAKFCSNRAGRLLGLIAPAA